MEGAICQGTLISLSSTTMFRGGGRRKAAEHSQSGINLIRKNPNNRFIKTHRLKTAAGINEVSAAAEAEITWQIVVGALAGVTPFVVAGIEFSKRIIAQRKCEVCGGSGLILRDNNYFRCPGCGGFLPWQSWKRFFSG